MVLVSNPAPAPAVRSTRPLAREIQALRALAVGLVIAYHLWPGVVRGGFVGVDVFFAVSGFLITGHLLRDIERSGKVHLATFWAARAKRLLPASLLTLAVSAVGVFVWVPAARWQQSFEEIRASALYVQNWLLASDSIDYLAADNAPSPVQHFWTLSVEEQFYVVLPLLLVLCLALGVRRLPAARRRAALGAMLGVVTLASAGYSLYLTSAAAPAAYFSTATRAWEFGLGGLLAASGAAWASRSPDGGSALARTVASWAGVALILLAGVLYTSATPFPSLTAALPVAGALAVMWAGWRPGRGGTASWMRWRAVQRLGDISYSAYLWHWPLIVLAPYALWRPLSGLDKALVLLAALLLAYASWRWVENPVRYSPRLLGAARPRLVAAWSAAGMALVVVIASIGAPLGPQIVARSIDEARALADSDTACFGASVPAGIQSVSASAALSAAAHRASHHVAQPSAGCDNAKLRGVLAPDPAVAEQDGLGRPACWDSVGSDTLKRCTYGPASGYAKRIALIGDSHANQHATAFIDVARQRNWQIVIMAKNGCYPTAMKAVREARSWERQCESWKVKLRTYLRGERFDAIVIAHAANAQVYAPAGVAQHDAVVSGIVKEWSGLLASGQRIIALRDNPIAINGIADCVRLNRQDVAACSRPRSEALGDTETAEAAEQVPGVQVVDLSDRYCDATTCYPIVNHAVVYRNEGHVTETFSRTLVPILGERLDKALAALS